MPTEITDKLLFILLTLFPTSQIEESNGTYLMDGNKLEMFGQDGFIFKILEQIDAVHSEQLQNDPGLFRSFTYYPDRKEARFHTSNGTNIPVSCFIDKVALTASNEEELSLSVQSMLINALYDYITRPFDVRTVNTSDTDEQVANKLMGMTMVNEHIEIFP